MKLHLTAEGFDLTGDLEKYADVKLRRLRRIIPKQLRAQAICSVHFKQVKRGDLKHNSCTLTVELADAEVKAQETTQHMYAALDIACVHIEHQLADYAAGRRRHRLRRLVRRPFRRAQ
jgi:ribosomal subunit interface protein